MKKLVDMIFLKKDLELLKKQHELFKLRDAKEALSKASGITDDVVLGKLAELNVRPEEAASLSTVPLVLVAWADGEMSPEEKSAIMASVEKLGWVRSGFKYTLLESWLERRPQPSLLDAWMHYVSGLCDMMSVEEKERFKDQIMSHAKAVAKASGGLFGIGAISGVERAMLDKLAGAFGLCSVA